MLSRDLSLASHMTHRCDATALLSQRGASACKPWQPLASYQLAGIPRSRRAAEKCERAARSAAPRTRAHSLLNFRAALAPPPPGPAPCGEVCPAGTVGWRCGRVYEDQVIWWRPGFSRAHDGVTEPDGGDWAPPEGFREWLAAWKEGDGKSTVKTPTKKPKRPRPQPKPKEDEPERRSNATARQEAARAKAAAYEKIRADEIARTTKAKPPPPKKPKKEPKAPPPPPSPPPAPIGATARHAATGASPRTAVNLTFNGLTMTSNSYRRQ